MRRVPIAVAVAAAITATVAPASQPSAEPLPGERCFPVEAVDGPGVVDPFRMVRPEAAQLNLAGKAAYRKSLWEAARTSYRAAAAADPDFLAPALNIACAFVRQERFAEATAELERLVGRSYLPWRDEILSAADLGALKVRPEWALVEAAMNRSRERWAEGLSEATLFVARTRQPLGLGEKPSSAGVFLLGPKQEVFAWSPRTLRYRQVTSEEGRVLAIFPSRDRQRLAYAVAEKVIREDGHATALRGVAVAVLDLRHLQILGRRALEGDLKALSLTEVADRFVFRPQGATANAPAETTAIRFDRGQWLPARLTAGAAERREVTLLPTGVASTVPTNAPDIVPGCPLRVRELRTSDGVPHLEARVTATHGRGRDGAPRAWRLGSAEYGAGLFGLPIP